jgi:O-antigen biosynthesis protein
MDLLRALPFPTPRPPDTLPKVTVAVCTRDRPDDLARCLDALTRLEYPSLDLLVVDNASRSEAPRRAVELLSHRGLRYVREPRLGLEWATNRAIAECRTEILAFTDDDALPDRHWVTALVGPFIDDPRVMAVTGLVAPDELETEAQSLFEAYGGFGSGFDRIRFQIDRERGESVAGRYGWSGIAGTGANMAFQRSVFNAIGPFEPALGAGTVSRGGGDVEMFFRVVKEGHALVYEPDAIVRHRHRRTYAELKTQLADWGIATCSVAVRSAFAYPDERRPLLTACGRWAKGKLATLFTSLKQPLPYPRRLILAQLTGVVRGLPRYGRAKLNVRRITRQAGAPSSGRVARNA